MTSAQLQKLQTDFCEFLRHGRHEGRIAAQLRPPSRDESAQRLDVYRNAYFIRLEKALAHDFPVTEKALGQKGFARLAGEYLLACPSHQPSLRHLGRDFPNWVRTQSGNRNGDLAAIEWAVMQVFDGPDQVAAKADGLQGIAPGAWHRLHIALVPTLSVLELSSNADRVWLARGQEADLRPMSTRWIAVSRDALFRPILTELDQETFAVLNALSIEPRLAMVNEDLAKAYDLEALPDIVARALHIAVANQWVASATVAHQEGGAN